MSSSTAKSSNNEQTVLPAILVIGATGQVGMKVVRELIEAGDSRVIAAVRSENKAAAIRKQFKDIETLILDLDNVDTMVPGSLAGIDRALLLTGYSVDMMKQSKRFLDAAKRDGVQHIVHIGASGAATNEVAHWTWHAMVEAYIEKLGFSYTHLQPEAFMQNILPSSFGWFNGKEVNHFIGDATWSWVDCADLALVASIALRKPEVHGNKTIRLGYDAKNMEEVGEILAEATGRTSIPVQSHDPDDFLKAVLSYGADKAYMDCVHTQFKLNIAGKIPGADETFVDTFEAITGRGPTTWKEFAASIANDMSDLATV